VELLESRSVGHGLWSSHQSHTDVKAEGDGIFGNLWGARGSGPPPKDGQETVYRLDLKLLSIEFLIVGGVSVILVVVLRNKKRTYSDYLVQCGASTLPERTGGDVEAAAPPDRDAITDLLPKTLELPLAAPHPIATQPQTQLKMGPM
jgi:hypothetical protein